ncbi:Protein GAMETOPHYTE DEFECTIVE 1 [Picochlorum sp. SENEW3]|nr:Protein GAMETOPHYTE DEFECTIVE 1 [Picochlorum sp. SENEW3]
MSSKASKKKKRRVTRKSKNRQWVDACLNDTTIDALTIKERATVAKKLSFSFASVSVYETIESYVENRQKKQKKRVKTTQAIEVDDPAVASTSIRRITLQLSSQVDEIARSLTGHVYGSLMEDYGLVAVRPTSDKTFQYACTTMDVDIISMQLMSSNSNGMVMRRQLIQQAVDRGVAFEIPYSGFLQQQRLQFISNARVLARATRGKNIVCSSGCGSVYEMRGPYDVANLLVVFLGLTEEQAYDCLSTTPLRLVEKRRQSFLRGRKNVVLTPVMDASAKEEEEEEGRKRKRKKKDSGLAVTERLFDIS